MDRALDDVISDRQKSNNNNNSRRGGRGGPQRRNNNDWPRDGVRKTRDDSRNLDRDWVHDKYEGDDDRPRGGNRRGGDNRGGGDRSGNRYSPERRDNSGTAKLKVDNLHYDLNEEDLDGLFRRIGPVTSVSLRYDRAGRSTGTAFVTYASMSSAKTAIREFDGANANGQPIHITLMPSGPADGPRGGGGGGGGASAGGARNPFDTVVKPAKSLFERVSAPADRDRSRSPDRPRVSDVSKPAPENIDRYVPGRRTRSPAPRREGRGGGGRRPGGRRDDSARNSDRGGARGRGGGETTGRDGRPKKTQEELDAEMEDYWGSSAAGVAAPGAENPGAPSEDAATKVTEADIDMIE